MKSKDLKRREAKERQDRWDKMSTTEKHQQKVEQGNEDTLEANLLLAESIKEKAMGK